MCAIYGSETARIVRGAMCTIGRSTRPCRTFDRAAPAGAAGAAITSARDVRKVSRDEERIGLETTKIFSDSAPHTLPHRQSLVSPSQRAIRPRIKEAPTYPRNRPTAAPPRLHCSSRQIGWGALREAPSPSPHARRVAHASSDALFARHDIPPQRKGRRAYQQKRHPTREQAQCSCCHQ